MRSTSRAFLAPWEPLWNADELTKSSFKHRVRFYVQNIKQDEGYAFFILTHKDERLLGGITLNNVKRGVTQSCTIGYWIGQPYANQGYMSEAIRLIIPYVFDKLGLHRLEASCLLDNVPSIKLLEKVGFQREGIARRYLKINSIWRDHILFALLSDDPRL